MNRITNFLFRLLASSVLMLAASWAMPALAQPGSGGPAPGAVTSVPIDAGALVLLAGGLIIGFRLLLTSRQARYQA